MKISLDIGGANIKYCIQDSNSKYIEGSIPIPSQHIFIYETNLELILTDIIKDSEIIIFTSTSELLYATKVEAEKRIISILKKSIEKNKIKPDVFLFSNIGKIISIDDYQAGCFAGGYNWYITKLYFKEKVKLNDSYIIIDCGSTSTDLIPVKNNKIMNFLERNEKKQFLYLGLKRSIVQQITNQKKRDGNIYRFCAEPVCRSCDIFFLLKELNENDYRSVSYIDCHMTALEQASRNVASLLCMDYTEISFEYIIDVCKEIQNKFNELIIEYLKYVVTDNNIKYTNLAIVGSSSKYIEKIIQKSNLTNISIDYVDANYTPAIGLMNIFNL